MQKHRIAIFGCGRMGQIYAQAYSTYPDTEIVGIADVNADRLKAVGERFGVDALFADIAGLLQTSPDIVAIIAPTKYMKDAVLLAAEAGVKGISTDKPIAGVLADADAMVDACESRGVVYAGGNLQRAMHEVQEAAGRIHSGEFGDLVGASIHGFGGEISGGGCQHISVLRLFANAEVEEVVAWGTPAEALDGDTDEGLVIHGHFRMTSGLSCQVFGTPTPHRGVDVWTQDTMISWDWGPPAIYRGYDDDGRRKPSDPGYAPYEWDEFGYLTGSIRSFLAAVSGDGQPWITGHDLRQALEVSIAAKQSALLGNAPVRLPLEDRSLFLFPRPYRWLGGDASGKPQSIDDAAAN